MRCACLWTQLGTRERLAPPGNRRCRGCHPAAPHRARRRRATRRLTPHTIQLREHALVPQRLALRLHQPYKHRRNIFALEIYCPASSLSLSVAAEKLLRGHLQANLTKANKLGWTKHGSGPVRGETTLMVLTDHLLPPAGTFLSPLTHLEH